MTTRLTAMLEGMRLLVFDADGTLRRTTVPNQPCPRTPHEWELLPGVRELLSTVDWSRGPRIGVASNQDWVGYGLIAPEMAESLLRDLITTATAGAVSDPLIRYCPHRLEEPCGCRKPAPGMLLDLMLTANARRTETLFVGNAGTDRDAATRAGCRFAWASDFFYAARDGDATPGSCGINRSPPAAPTSSA